MATSKYQIVSGTDEFLVQRRARALFMVAAEGLDDWSRDVIDGRVQLVGDVATVVSRFQEAVQTLSMFGEKKAVWLQDVNFLTDSVVGRSDTTKAELERLQAVLESIDEENVSVVVSVCPADRRRREFKWLESHGEAFREDAGKDAGSLIPLAREEMARYGASLDDAAAERLVALVAGNGRVLVAECRKLATYANGEPITEQLVAELVSPLPESEFFAAVEAFFSGNLSATLREVRQHFFAGHDARPLLAMFLNRNRLVLQLAILREAGALGGRVSKAALEKAASRWGGAFPPDEKSNLNVFSQNPFYLGRMMGSLDHFTIAQLRANQKRFIATYRILTTEAGRNQEGIIRNLVVTCLAQVRRASA